MQRGEQQIQRVVVQHVELRAPRGCVWFCVPNPRSRVAGAILKGLGMQSGLPDLIFIYAGKVYGLELKAGRGRLSAAQVACHERLVAAGASVATATGIDQALEQLKTWGLLR